WKLREGLDEILNSNMSIRNKTECFELLVQTVNHKGYTEDSKIFREKKFYFNELRESGLISKNRNSAGKTIWIVSKELSEFDSLVYNRFAYYLDDYFLKLFEGRIQIKKLESQESETKELKSIRALVDKFASRTDTKSKSVLMFLAEVNSFH